MSGAWHVSHPLSVYRIALPADAALDKAGVWAAPVAAESPLLSAATLAKLQPSEAAYVPLLAQVLLLQHSKRLKSGGDWYERSDAGCPVLGSDVVKACPGQP